MDQGFTIVTLILMGDWCSEELTPYRMKLRQW
jgi:hypothetical protein